MAAADPRANEQHRVEHRVRAEPARTVGAERRVSNARLDETVQVDARDTATPGIQEVVDGPERGRETVTDPALPAAGSAVGLVDPGGETETTGRRHQRSDQRVLTGPDLRRQQLTNRGPVPVASRRRVGVLGEERDVLVLVGRVAVQPISHGRAPGRVRPGDRNRGCSGRDGLPIGRDLGLVGVVAVVPGPGVFCGEQIGLVADLDARE